MKYQISENIYAIAENVVGTHKEFSFIAYLITGEKNILIDTMPAQFFSTLMDDMASIIGNAPLDTIIMNHSEQDHSGALIFVLEKCPNIPIYCTSACKARLSKSFPNANYQTVKTGDTLKKNEHEFVFYETPGLHWDDNMVTFLKTSGILFSNDLFGQYTSAVPPVDTRCKEEHLADMANQYYLSVFDSALVQDKRVLFDLENLPIKTIAPGHGVVLKNHFAAILKLYLNKIKRY